MSTDPTLPRVVAVSDTPGESRPLGWAAAHLSETERYATDLTVGRHRLTADEPSQPRNPSVGPTPLGLLLASLASCTAITLRMYAERKYTDFGEIDVRVSAGAGRDRPRVLRRIHVSVPTSPEDLEHLGSIADRTPVTLILTRGMDLRTELASGPRGGSRAAR